MFQTQPVIDVLHVYVTEKRWEDSPKSILLFATYKGTPELISDVVEIENA